MYNDEKNALPKQVDLNELAKRHDLRIVIEPRERLSTTKGREAQTTLEGAYRRKKDWLLFRVAVFGAVLLGALCVLIIFTKSHNLDHSNWATATLTSLVTGTIAYLSGKSN